MNYIELFAKGGLTKSERLAGEQVGIPILEDLQELTGVDPNQAVEILNQIGENNPEIFTNIQNYIDIAKNPQSDENTRSNAISKLTKIFNPSMESQIFKCGGKLQQLVTKFGKGGGVDCGCGGIKLDNGGRTISADGSITIVNPNTAQADTLGRYGYSSTNGKFQLLSNGERNATVWDNTGGFPIARYANETFMQNHPVRTFLGGYKKAPAGYFENLVDRVNNRFDQNGVPVKQDGGTVNYEEMPGHDVDTRLTRRQARELARANGMSENNEQFSFAMANAMNAARAMGLRGQEARERAREMAAGISGMDRSLQDIPTEVNVGIISGPKKYEGIVSAGDLQMLNPEITKPIGKSSVSSNKPNKSVKPQFTGPSVGESLAAQRAKTNAGYQYQYERALYDQANGNYRPNQGSAEYQHGMGKDFNDAGDDNTNSVKRDFLMRSPSSQEINAFRGAGQFTHGVLPGSRSDRESYGVDYNKRQFYFNDDSRYRADAQAGGIPASSNLYEGTAKALAPIVVGVPAAGIISGALTGSEAADAALGEVHPIRYIKNAATDFARGGANVNKAAPRYGVSSPNGVSRITGFNSQTPATADGAINGMTTPRAFPYGFKQGGQIEKARQGTSSSFGNKISNPRETYTDGYGTQREVSEPKSVTIGRKFYNGVNTFLNGQGAGLSNEEYRTKYGYYPPETESGILGLMAPTGAATKGLSALEKAKIASDRGKIIGDTAMTLTGIGAAAAAGNEIQKQRSK